MKTNDENFCEIYCVSSILCKYETTIYALSITPTHFNENISWHQKLYWLIHTFLCFGFGLIHRLFYTRCNSKQYYIIQYFFIWCKIWKIHRGIRFSSQSLYACEFQANLRLITMSLIKCLKLKLLYLYLRIKDGLLNWIINDIWLTRNSVCVCVLKA